MRSAGKELLGRTSVGSPDLAVRLAIPWTHRTLPLHLPPTQDKKAVSHVVQRLARGCEWCVIMPEE